MTVLVVDDDEDLRQVLRDEFEFRGLKTFGAEDGHVALDVLEDEDIHFVVSDIQMPKMDGVGFLKASREKAPDTPVFLISAGSKYKYDELIAHGAAEFFDKSNLDFDRMIEMATKLVEKKV